MASLLNVADLRKMLRKLGPDALERAAKPALERVLAIVEAKAVELSPVDTGNLDASTVVTVESATPGRVAGTVAFSTPYALTQHEGIDPRTGQALMPGKRTQAKPGNEFGAAGPKFLERVLRGAHQFLPEAVVSLLRDAWRGL